MKALKLGEVEDFPFVDAPSSRAIADGYQLLSELNAVDEQRRLTPIGSQLAKLPVDPRIARMIVAARDEGCLSEILIIASGLAIPDPRDRPMDKQELADTAHAQFQDERSEFAGLLKLWAFFDEALKHKKSNRKLAQACREYFLSSRAAARMARSARTVACARIGDGLASEREAGDRRPDSPRAAGRTARQHRIEVR